MEKAHKNEADRTLYERLGGVYAIAAVVDRFSDRLLKNPIIVNANPALQKWHTKEYKHRLAGLKFMRTLWMCAVTGGDFQYTGKHLHEAHLALHISPEVFDEVALELSNTLDYFKVPKREKEEVLAAFNARKPDVATDVLPRMKRPDIPEPMLHHHHQ